MKDDRGRKWYLTIVAAVYLVLCTAGCLHYLSLRFRADDGTVPMMQQVLCLAFAVASGTYFLRARIGHIALTLLTVLTLLAIGTSSSRATAFHLYVLLILLVPFIQKQKNTPSETKPF